MLSEIAKEEGAFICPEGAATFGAAKLLREQGWIQETDIFFFFFFFFGYDPLPLFF